MPPLETMIHMDKYDLVHVLIQSNSYDSDSEPTACSPSGRGTGSLALGVARYVTARATASTVQAGVRTQGGRPVGRPEDSYLISPASGSHCRRQGAIYIQLTKVKSTSSGGRDRVPRVVAWCVVPGGKGTAHTRWRHIHSAHEGQVYIIAAVAVSHASSRRALSPGGIPAQPKQTNIHIPALPTPRHQPARCRLSRLRCPPWVPQR